MSERDDLITAAETGEAERIRELLAADPSLASARDADGVSVLLHARYGGHAEAVSAILAAVPQTDIFDASAVGLNERVAELIGADPALVDAINVDGFRPLHLGAFFGNTVVVQMLLAAGADASAVSANGMALQPLHAAAASGRAGIAGMLIEAGADPNAQQAGGYTPLDAADQNGDVELANLLESAGAVR